jgi:hypothetical protein
MHGRGHCADLNRCCCQPCGPGERRNDVLSRPRQERDAANAANNPLTPSIAFNFEDHDVPDMLNLPQGYYLRSSAIWNFDFENDNHFIPASICNSRLGNERFERPHAVIR